MSVDTTTNGAMVLRRNLSLHTLNSVSRLLATLDFEEILDSIVSAAIELLGASRGLLFLIDDSGKLELKVGRSASGEAIAAGVAPEISMSLVRQALTERKCVYVRREAGRVLDPDSSMSRLNIGAALCVPMTVTDLRKRRAGAAERRRTWMSTRDVMGVIYIDRPEPGKDLSAEDYALYASMGNLAAAALVNAAIYQDAITDGLTGLAHRRHFEHSLSFETDRARREGQPLSLLMIDLDFFKQVNDTHGHLVGDEVLRSTGRLLKARTRPGDLAARYGGEEFAVLLPDTLLLQAIQVGEALRAALRGEFGPGSPIRITMSIGAATYEPARDRTQEDLVKRADEALYASKRDGRDRVTAWSAVLDEAGVRTDGLRGIFSGEPSRDYRVMNLLMEVIEDFGAGGSAVERLERTLERIRDFISARRIAVFRPDGSRLALVSQSPSRTGPATASALDAASDWTPSPRVETGSWTRELKRDSSSLGTLVVHGQDSAYTPGDRDTAILDALAVQVALLVENIGVAKPPEAPRKGARA